MGNAVYPRNKVPGSGGDSAEKAKVIPGPEGRWGCPWEKKALRSIVATNRSGSLENNLEWGRGKEADISQKSSKRRRRDNRSLMSNTVDVGNGAPSGRPRLLRGGTPAAGRIGVTRPGGHERKTQGLTGGWGLHPQRNSSCGGARSLEKRGGGESHTGGRTRERNVSRGGGWRLATNQKPNPRLGQEKTAKLRVLISLGSLQRSRGGN